DLEAGGFRLRAHATDHGADLGQGETELLAGQDGGDAGTIGLAVKPGVLLAPRRDEALALVETQCPQRYAEFAGQFADGEFPMFGNRNGPVAMGDRLGFVVDPNDVGRVIRGDRRVFHGSCRPYCCRAPCRWRLAWPTRYGTSWPPGIRNCTHPGFPRCG